MEIHKEFYEATMGVIDAIARTSIIFILGTLFGIYKAVKEETRKP